MVSLSPLYLLFLTFTLTLLAGSVNVTVAATTEYLKLPLLHRTSFPSDVLSSDIRRHSLLHHRHRSSAKSPVVSGAPSGSGQYFVSLRLGSPPQTLLLVADTGSDLIWVKCSACKNCSAHPPGSAFFPRRSSTFSPIHCFQSLCQLVPNPDPNPCNHTRIHSTCRYEYSYSDGSITSGFFSKETTTLNTSAGEEKKLMDLSFGCGFRVSGPSVTGASFNGAQGVMGLGRGPISFSTQLGRRFGNKFSYCLLDYTLSPAPTSFLVIGGENHSIPEKKAMNFTPLLFNPLSPTFYYIGIKSVSVDGVKLKINPSVWSIDELGNGGTIIDSGTTLTLFAEPAYREILKAFKRRVKLPRPHEATSLGFDLCVNVTGIRKPRFPRMTLEVEGRSALRPPARNYIIETSEGVKCLAIRVVEGTGPSVIGNLMQQGFLLEFDRDVSRLAFSRRGCGSP